MSRKQDEARGASAATAKPSQSLVETFAGLLWSLRTKEKPCLSGAFPEADEGTRTLDLLHGKQTL